MGRTLSEQIISRAAGRQVRAGDVVTLAADTVMVHDSIAPSVIRILREQLGCERIPDPDRVAVGIDHVAPASTPATAKAQQGLRAWVREQGIENFFESGRGIAHQVLIEERLARPGRLLVGSDSHSTAYGAVGAFGTGMGATDIALLLATGKVWMRVPATILVRVTGRFGPGIRPKDLALRLCRRLRSDGATYAALEYHGLDELSPGERTTIATMAVEVGAKAGIVVPVGLPPEYPVPDWLKVEPDAACQDEIEIDLDALSPQIALPDTVDNVCDLSELGDVPVDVVYVGTCTNGRHEDMAAVARMLEGRQIARGVRLMVVPASRDAFQDAIADGTISTLVAAGATIGPPGCGACIGRHMGVLAPGETCLFTGNRNYRGRMGSPEARIYLGSPEVAAATAITGRITDPRALQTSDVTIASESQARQETGAV